MKKRRRGGERCGDGVVSGGGAGAGEVWCRAAVKSRLGRFFNS